MSKRIIGGMSDLVIPKWDVPIDVRRPLTLEQLIKDCGDKMRHEASEKADGFVEIILGAEVLMELALRVLSLEAHAGLIPLEEPPISGPQGHTHGI